MASETLSASVTQMSTLRWYNGPLRIACGVLGHMRTMILNAIGDTIRPCTCLETEADPPKCSSVDKQSRNKYNYSKELEIENIYLFEVYIYIYKSC